MSISHETQRKIGQFAKEQSLFYLDDAHMTYMEKLRAKGHNAKNKVEAKLSRVKSTSQQGKEAQDDMILYMNDYMDDLMARGHSEQEAFEKASADLSFESKSSQAETLQDRFRQNYEKRDVGTSEAVDLYYGAGGVLGVVFGGVAGLLVGRILFEDVPLWISIAVGVGVGAMIGAGFAMLKNASLVRKRDR